MSIELANEKWLGYNPNGLLGQFASTRGYSDLIEAVEGKEEYPALNEFFETGVTGKVETCRAELKRLANDSDTPVDVISTAKALRDLADGLEVAIITNGAN